MLVGREDIWAGAGIGVSVLVLSAVALHRCLPLGSAEGDRQPMPRARKAFLLAGVGLVVALGLFPQLLFPWVIRAAQGLGNLIS
jgi:hypothetical protein